MCVKLWSLSLGRSLSDFLLHFGLPGDIGASGIRSNVWHIALIMTVVSLAHCGCDGGDSEKFQKIPSGEIYTTAIQKGLEHVSLGDHLPFKGQIEIFNQLQPSASNLFLTQANDLNEAVEAGVRLQGRANLRLPKDAKDSEIWLVVFFGRAQSSPQNWTIDSVEFSQTKVRVNYTVPSKIIIRTRDYVPYFAFVRLKDLIAGRYDLELRESGSKEVTLMRKVRLQPPER
jgi:hypothetical protein